MIRIERLRPAALGIAVAVLLAACGTQPQIRQPGIPGGPVTATPEAVSYTHLTLPTTPYV